MKSYLVLFVIIPLVSVNAWARWATEKDSPAISEFDKAKMEIRSDGSWTAKRDSQLKILNEEGRSQLGTSNIKYNARTSKISDLEAETIHEDGSSQSVPKDFIEDKSLASSAEGFDDTRQLSIAFPKVEVGSRLHLKYREDLNEVPIKDFFSREFLFGTDIIEQNTEIEIHSKLPLFIETNDPHAVLDISDRKDGDEQVIVIKLKKPLFTKPIDETDAYLNHSDMTWVVLSSSKDYALLGNSVTQEYEAVLNADLPAPFKTILEAARKEKTLTDQANTITSLLADQVRYLGDWRPRRGGHIPRSLETISSTKFGDCKDFASVTAAILRKLGHTAWVAWVERGMKPTPLPKLALDSAFNHAIVAVETKEGIRWLDPTNYASFAQGIFDDIQGRPALLIVPSHSHMEEIPISPANQSELSRISNLAFDLNGDAILRADLSYQGRGATLVTGLTREMSTESINYLLAKAVAEDNYVKWTKVQNYDLSSRIVKDTFFKIEVGVKNMALQTTAGLAYQMPRGDLRSLLEMEPSNRVSDYYLGNYEIVRITYQIDQAQLIGHLPRGCELDSPWMKISRVFKKTKTGIEISDKREIKKRNLTNKEIKGAIFGKFQDSLQSCFRQVAVVFRTTKKRSHLESSSGKP